MERTYNGVSIDYAAKNALKLIGADVPEMFVAALSHAFKMSMAKHGNKAKQGASDLAKKLQESFHDFYGEPGYYWLPRMPIPR